MKTKSGLMHHIAKPAAVKKGAAPFASTFSNNRPMANPGSATSSSPAGKSTQYRDKGRSGLFRGRGARGA